MDGTHISQPEKGKGKRKRKKEKGCWYSVDELNTSRLAQAPLRPSSSDEQ
jgi:hypothetical protein